ncbi:helix-turn-helix domain-containing protein [Rubinisphaera margarita]|uniref:helix-turn-helix domain-containing protein n=1 Tax=Rubinisphaera margarita TaxID=2909586 RepID=UPI001EE951B3|nr:helix-turn-helix domain-containing protein [Rubinisphaera margarita]MCG6157106.1 helix-turn-helix domain-containing protein [Rubinisphaera margarita]
MKNLDPQDAAVLITKQKLASLLSISQRQVNRLMDDGCPTIRIGNAPRFDYEAVREWLIKRENEEDAHVDSRDWLKVKDIAEQLQVKRDKVLYWIATGKLQAVNLNTGEPSRRAMYRVKRSALDAFLLTKQVLVPPKLPRRKKRPAVTRRYE